MNKNLTCSYNDGYWFSTLHAFQNANTIHDAIIINKESIHTVLGYINEKRITKVIIDLSDNGISNLSFLRNLNSIEHLRIIGNGKMDYSPLYQLINLRSLSLLNPSQLSLEPFINLELFSSDCVHMIQDIGKVTSLKSLMITDMERKLKWTDLRPIENLINIDTLSLNGLPISNMDGIEKLTNLQVLLLSNLSSLTNITTLNTLRESITNLRLFNCSSLIDLKTLSYLKSLRFLSIDSMNTINNIDFVNELDNLNTFISVNSNIADGNLTNLLNLNHVVVFPLRKNYYTISNNLAKKVTITSFNYGYRLTGDDDIDMWRRLAY